MTFAANLRIADRILLIFGLIKLMLIFAFFASFGFLQFQPANAQTADACNGINLLEKLEREKPQAYASVVAEGEAIENSGSILWELEKPGLEPSYLFGTMHLADPDISELPDDVRAVFDESHTLIVESTDVLDPKSAQQAMAKLAHLTLLTEGTLRDRIDDDLEDELKVAVEKRGIPMPLADRMQPWVVATTISLPVCEVIRKRSGELVLDAELARQAGEQGKEIVGLETAEEQLEAIAYLPEDFHISSLEETLAAGELSNDMTHTLKELYKSGQMGFVFPLMRTVLPKAGSGEGIAKFQEVLIEKRNVKMSERTVPHLENGGVFVAVGALHLPGPTGLVKLLRNEGFTVTSLR